MGHTDSFRWIDQDEAVAAGCFLIAIACAWMGATVEEPTVQQPVVATTNCHVTVAQYGPAERWSPKSRQPECAGAMVELPPHILTSPMEPQ